MEKENFEKFLSDQRMLATSGVVESEMEKI